MWRILCVDDEVGVSEYLKMILPKNCQLIPVNNERQFMDFPWEGALDLVLLDIDFARGQGRKLLDLIIERVHPAPVIVHTRSSNVADAVGCMKQGVLDFMQKPLSPKSLLNILNRLPPNVFVSQHIVSELEAALGKGPVWKRFLDTCQIFRDPGDSCLISGEQGTGKYLVAKALHDAVFQESPVGGKIIRDRFVTYNPCGRDAKTQHADLLGDIKSGKPGLLERMEGGTLHMEEFENLDLSIQSILLRALQTKKIAHTGTRIDVPVHFRLILGTCLSWEKVQENNRILQELALWCKACRIHLPPVRDRTKEFPALAWYYLNQFRMIYPETRIKSFSPQAMEYLQQKSWFENIRNLRQVIFLACLRSTGDQLKVQDIHPW